MNRNENIVPPETPVTRDEVVAAFRKFAGRGITDPANLDRTDPEVQEANALLEKWVAQEEERTANDPAAARRFGIERTKIFLDAGFTDSEYAGDVTEDFLEQEAGDLENPPLNPEREPVFYDQILAAAKSLHDAGVKNPRDVSNPLVMRALEIVGFWRSQEGIPADADLGREGQRMHGIDSVEKAENIVKSVTLWIEAGYADRSRLDTVIEALGYAGRDAEQDGAGEEVLAVFGAARKSLEARIESSGSGKKWEGEVATEIENAVDMAKEDFRAGKRWSAVGRLNPFILSSALPKHKRYFASHPGEKARITKMRDDIRDGKDLSEYGL
ncbi:MAG: hypothetical protein Q7S84_03980 [bacterium]|nr:hypothetical protein [bacterium]